MTVLSVLVNGAECTQVSATDRGLLYGDGLFETIAVHEGRPCRWDAHISRLRLGAERLDIPCPDESLLRCECQAVVGGTARCIIKLILTRGAGGRGYRPPAEPRPTRILTRHPWPDYPGDWSYSGVSVGVCRTRLSEQPILAGIKHLNRLDQVLARSEWDDPTRAEGLMCDRRGRVICGTMSNLFVFTLDGLATPRLDSCGIAGTVRDLVLRACPRFGIAATERHLGLSDLVGAQGLFLTNALIGVWPVRHLGKRRYDVRRLPLDLLDWVRAAAHQPDPEYLNPCAPC